MGVKNIIARYRIYGALQEFRVSAALAIVFFAASLVLFVYSVNFATEHASNAVTDVILSNTPVFDVGWFFVYGAGALVIFITLLCLVHPKRIPFTLHSLTLLIVVRSIFTMLTHIGPFPTQASSDFSDATTKLLFGGDLFFSNHTAIPFLMALMYWHNKTLRYIFILCSVFFGAIALMGHLHYTIDVLSAYFITFSIYQIACWLFPKDRLLFFSEYQAK